MTCTFRWAAALRLIATTLRNRHPSSKARLKPPFAVENRSCEQVRQSTIPANAPQFLHNALQGTSTVALHLLTRRQEELFRAVGVPVATGTTPPPKLDKTAEAEMMAKTIALLPKYRTEMVKPINPKLNP